ncbi:efflux RND transporter permease subunit [Pelagibacterium xiamenense]|uniref:efflux RND transporter permease subunit n=1 Tax=Pelagibacterium xiamenense TaxID=2901140 RepID=UPI001E5AB2FE|nr:efflux RND transporter permease subunit [Pelagibacterium xiamenense]MCD7059617.1 efflux RND transporter permease subunit [Pelagibacterium xiamenense]
MMNFLEAVLRRPKTVLTAMFVLLVAGVSAYINLPKENMPNIDVPYLYVSVSQSGVSPSDAETLLARPLEQELRDLENLEHISSTSTTGHASIFLEFNINADKDKAMEDTRQRVDLARSQLPSDADDPTVHEVDVSGFPIITVAVSGNVPERTLTTYAEELQDAIEGISTVREVELSGTREEVLEIDVDLLKLESYGLTTNEVLDALARNNMVVPAGALNTGQGQFNLEVPGLIENAQQVYSLPLKTVNDTVVTFSDVATIKRTFKDATEYTRANGDPALILGVSKRTGTNIIDNSQSVRRVVAETTADWPSAINVSFMLDQAVSAEDMLTSLQGSVITAVVLVIIAAVAMLGLRPALLIGLSIPISFMTAFLILQFMGINISMMVMFGLILTVGMLVDSAVVMVEYSERKISEGLPRKEAFIRAARLMFVPILSSMGTTIAAFLPLLLWPGIIGKFMSYLPLTVIVTLVASFITAMVFIPVVGGIVARKKISQAEKERADALSGAAAATFDPKNVPGPAGVYVRTLAFFVRHPILVLVLVFGGIGGIFFAYASNPTGMVAFPEVEPEYATVAVTGRGNYSPEQIRDIMVEVEQAVLPVEGISEMIMNFGSTGAVASVPSDTIGNLQLELAPWKDRRKASAIFADIRERTANIAGVGIQLVEAEGGPPAGKDINLTIKSTVYEDLGPAVARVRDYIENDLGNTIDVEDTRPLPGIDWKVTIDRDMAARFGIGVRELSPYVQLVTSGLTIGSYRPDDADDSLDIVVRLPQDERTFEALDTMRIVTPSGLVPVSNFIHREAAPKVANINREDEAYVMNVLANVDGVDAETGAEVMTATKVAELQAWMAEQDWPSSITFDFGGADEQTQETNQFLSQAGLAVIFLMFLILLTQFNSFYQVLLTLSTVIMSTAGVVLGMMVTGQPFSAIMTGIGIVSLAGIVVNNSIILIDTFNRFRDENVDPVVATLMTGAQRLRPIMLTTVTTVAGLVPMALGVNFDFFNRILEVNGLSGGWWSYLTTAVISGLTFSTLLTLIVVPVMLVAPYLWKQQIMAAARFVGALGVSLMGLFGRKPKAQPAGQVAAPAGAVPETMANANANEPDRTGLVETEKNGVTVVSRQAAE